MKSSVTAAAIFTGIVTAANSASGETGSPSSSAFVPSPSQYILFADNIQAVSQALPNEAFLRSSDLYTITPNDFGTASSFTFPDFSVDKVCSLNFFVPSVDQVGGDINKVMFSGSGNLNFSRLVTKLPNSGLTFNTLGRIQDPGVEKLTPGKNLQLASFPCLLVGTELPVLVQSPADSADTTLSVRDGFGPYGVTGLFVVIEPVYGPPVNPPPTSWSSPSSGGPVYTKSSYATGGAWSSGDSYYGTTSGPDSFATYSSVGHSGVRDWDNER